MSMEYRGMSSSSVQGQEIQNRTLLLLQAIIALCLWALVALMSWRWIFDVRDTPIEQITPGGLKVGGKDYALDAIVFATGAGSPAGPETTNSAHEEMS